MEHFLDPFRDDPNVRYAAKYPMESNIGFHGIWQCDVWRKGVLVSGGYPEPPNIFPTAGIAYMLNIMFHDIAKVSNWYIGMIRANVTPLAGDTAAVHLGTSGTYLPCQETTHVDESTFEAYTTVDTTTDTITNSASPAEFTIAATSLNLYGAFLTTISDPTSNSGYIMAAKRFTSAPRATVADDVISITYTIKVTSS
jgi:hypothetical protein